MLSPQLKKAIKELSEAEKDKLLLRLLPKNPDLCNRLEYELVENSDTLEERREKLAEEIKAKMNEEAYSPGYLMMDMRSLSGDITRHVKTTKDKYGEVSLTLLMLLEGLEKHNDYIKTNIRKAGSILDYMFNRALTALEKLKKLHPDLHVEFESDMNSVLSLLHNLAPGLAKEYKLPKQFEG